MFDHAKAIEDAKKMEPARIERIRQLVRKALLQGWRFEQFMQEVACEQCRR